MMNILNTNIFFSILLYNIQIVFVQNYLEKKNKKMLDYFEFKCCNLI